MKSSIPFLTRVATNNFARAGEFPFTLPFLKDGLDLQLESFVTFFAGENGSGKSTLLEAIAERCGFNPAGGSRNHTYARHETESGLSSAIQLVWRKRIGQGFFLRAASFFNFATYIEETSGMRGESLHQRSHGESFLAAFENYFDLDEGIYLLDEPEAALSPARQLAFLRVLYDLSESKRGQFIVATHSPIILGFPGAKVFWFGESGLREIPYRETEHYRITRGFLENPERYLRHLFSEDE